MSIGKRAEGVIGVKSTLGLIDYIHNQGGMVAPDVLVENVAILFGVSRAKILNTITLLKNLGIVEMHNGWISTSEAVVEPKALGERLVNYVVEQHLVPGFGDAMLLAEETGEVWVDAKRAPGRHLGIGALLVELGVFHRDRLTSTNWRIGKRYTEQFIQAIAKSNDNIALGMLSSDDLRQKVEENLEAGLKAEEWVVSFEKNRLKEHPLRGQIRRVSDRHANAGFDVLSFRDRSSIAYNWLIEVKSYVDVPRFYWTTNEIDCARRQGERYVLYLVDRSQMQIEGYEPRVITGPYEFFFGTDLPNGWDMVANEYRISVSA